LRQTLDLQDNPQEQFRTLARSIGSRADYVARLLTGLRVYEEIATKHNFFGIENLNEESINFSVLTTALNYANLATFIGLRGRGDPDLEQLDERRLREVTEWMFAKDTNNRTRLGESRRLQELNIIVAHEEALKAFRGGSTLADAYLQAEEDPLVVFRQAIYEARERLKIANRRVDSVDAPSRTDAAMLDEVQRLAVHLKSRIDEQLSASLDL
jgi:hypothetical protein